MTLTLPAPVVTTPQSPYADMKGRSRKITYQVSETGAVIVTISHDKARKTYNVSIQPVRIEQQRGYQVTTFVGFSGVHCARVPAGARFSAKDLDAVTARTIENIPVIVASDPAIAAMFETPESASSQMFPR